MHLDDATFLTVIAATPLVSIDLIIRNHGAQVLLGERRNRPAQGMWFVPGGRIRKNETVADALSRVAMAELGTSIGPARIRGAFDHIYPDNFAGTPGINTHYVVLAFDAMLPDNAALRPDTQHSSLRWWDVNALLRSEHVHENTKAYFRPPA